MPKARPSLLAAAWLALYAGLCWAESLTFAQEVWQYDFASLGVAVLAGLAGGVGRTIYTLFSPHAVVGDFKRLLFKDLVVALLGGAIAFFLIEAYNQIAAWFSSGSFQITRGARMLTILGFGFARGKWLGALDRFTADAIFRARTKLRGAAPVDQPPAVSTRPAPLE